MSVEILDAATEARCAPDMIAPPRVGDGRQLTPCESLVFAILMEAMRDYMIGRPAIRMDAERWFCGRSRAFGQYRWCCDILKLDPEYLWANRHRWKLAQQQSGSRTTVVVLRAAA
ncbi:MAG: hypothetical protein SF182_01630 [Deltaproteobacteria bacterium]|nr:hypothetical protein [Deltaproteobacteria bacterium]